MWVPPPPPPNCGVRIGAAARLVPRPLMQQRRQRRLRMRSVQPSLQDSWWTRPWPPPVASHSLQAASLRAVRAQSYCVQCRGTGRTTCSACQGAGIMQNEPVRMNQIKHAGEGPVQSPRRAQGGRRRATQQLQRGRRHAAPRPGPRPPCVRDPRPGRRPPLRAAGKVKVLLGINDTKMHDSDWQLTNRCVDVGSALQTCCGRYPPCNGRHRARRLLAQGGWLAGWLAGWLLPVLTMTAPPARPACRCKRCRGTGALPCVHCSGTGLLGPQPRK